MKKLTRPAILKEAELLQKKKKKKKKKKILELFFFFFLFFEFIVGFLKFSIFPADFNTFL